MTRPASRRLRRVSSCGKYHWPVASNINDAEADRLEHELAAATGDSITEPSGCIRAELDAIIARGRIRTVLDTRSNDDVLGYDEHGLPG